jgi:hypothetical protein
MGGQALALMISMFSVNVQSMSTGFACEKALAGRERQQSD